MKHFIDARGLTCPLPVVNTKNEIKTMREGEEVEVIVDNEIAVQNLIKFAKVKQHQIRHELQGEKEYHVWITVGEKQTNDPQPQEISCTTEIRWNQSVVVIASNTMGNGDEALGVALMKAYLFALTKQEEYPKTMLFYNKGAFLTCEGSDSLEDLQMLAAEGVEILTCGTCLNYYGLSEKLAIGGVTNMYDIVEKMMQASKVIKP